MSSAFASFWRQAWGKEWSLKWMTSVIGLPRKLSSGVRPKSLEAAALLSTISHVSGFRLKTASEVICRSES
jgi:hypothetical protein